MRRIATMTLFLCAALAGGASVYYAFDYVGEQRALAAFLDSRLEHLSEGDVVAELDDLTAFMKTLPSDETTERVDYLNPLYSILRARPLDVLRLGGYCGNKSRLLLALLHLQGIPARLAYIYNPEAVGWKRVRQPYITAFVEVEVDHRWIVVDPFLGFVYRNADGDPATAKELAADPSLISRQAPPWFDPAVYNYRDIRGIRWIKTPAGEKIRNGLARLTSEEWVESLHYPFWIHRPNLVLALLGATTSLICLTAAYWIRRGAGRTRR